MAADPRRHHIIEVRQLSGRVYRLTIDGVLWSEVEWSSARRAWCVQDAAGHCLTHAEHIHAEEIDAETAVLRVQEQLRHRGLGALP
jgi:hypothetical protein